MTAMDPVAAPRAFALRPAVTALARSEGRRLLRHPFVLFGSLLSLLVSVSLAATVTVGGAYLVLTGPTLLPLGIATLVAADLAAVRSRRDRTGELYASAPAPAGTRTLGQLTALGWPAALGLLLAVGVAAGFGVPDGMPVDGTGRTAVPSPQEILQVPAMIVLLGALGIALGRWIPHVAAALVVSVGLFAFQMPAAMWNYHELGAWFLPIVNPAETPPEMSWPCSTDQPSPCPFFGFARAAMAWHLLYVAGLTAVLAALALLRDGRRSSRVALAVAGAVAAATGGFLQVA